MNHLFLCMVFVCALVLCAIVHAEEEVPDSAYGGEKLTYLEKREVKRRANFELGKIKSDLRKGDLSSLAKKTDESIEQLVRMGLKELRDHGDADAAYQYEFQFRTEIRGYLTRMVEERDIGDHKPLIQWLEDFYDRLELVVGITVLKMTHLSDIKTLNCCIPVVFKPCTFPMDMVMIERKDEYRKHFAEGSLYYGLLPVVTYWVIEVPCFFAGGTFLCMPIASVGEYLMGTFAAPKLSDIVFDKTCK